MVDAEFLAELRTSTETAMAQYELTAEERAVVVSAVARLAKAPAHRQPDQLKSELLRRVAT
jgi:hypothetical protein